MTKERKLFQETQCPCQTVHCYSCHRHAHRERFTLRGKRLTDCWCLGQGCACFLSKEIGLDTESKGFSLDLHVALFMIYFRETKQQNMYTMYESARNWSNYLWKTCLNILFFVEIFVNSMLRSSEVFMSPHTAGSVVTLRNWHDCIIILKCLFQLLLMVTFTFIQYPVSCIKCSTNNF